jgi:hypothetical protein
MHDALSREGGAMNRISTIALVAAVATAGAACGKAAIPTERLGRAEGAVRSARETGAESEPTAALHVRLAQENLARAKGLIDRGENERASYLLMRAEADADLAKTLHEEASAQEGAERAMSQLSAVRNAPDTEGK